MAKDPKIMRKIRSESGISSNQLRSFIGHLSETGMETASVPQSTIQQREHRESLESKWKSYVDERYAMQMQRYILFAIGETYTSLSNDFSLKEDASILLPFSRQKLYISRSLAFELISLNSKLAACISDESTETPALTTSELQYFTIDYLNYLWSSPKDVLRYQKELLSLALTDKEEVLNCWRDASEAGWNCLLDAASTEFSQSKVLNLLCKLHNTRKTSETTSNYRGLEIVRRLYGSFSRSSPENATIESACKGTPSRAVWDRLANSTDADGWHSQLIDDGDHFAPEKIAQRDMSLIDLLGNKEDVDWDSMKPLCDGIHQYLNASYATESAVLRKHLSAVESKICEESEKANELIKWMMFEIPPCALMSQKSLMDIVLRKVSSIASPSLFLHIVQVWPSGEYLKPLLRRAFTQLKFSEKIEILGSSTDYSYPDGVQGWNKDLRRCLNRISKNEVPSIIEEVNLLVLFDARGVLSAIIESAINNKGSFDLMLMLLDSLSFTFSLKKTEGSEQCLLSLVLQPFLQRAWSNDLSNDQASGWQHLCQDFSRLDSLKEDSGVLLLRLINDLVTSNLQTRKSVVPILRLANTLVDAVKEFPIDELHDQDNIYSLFLFAVFRVDAGDFTDQEAEGEDDGDEETEEAIELIERMQIKAFLPIICQSPLVNLLKFHQPLSMQLLCRHVLQLSDVSISLEGAHLGRTINSEAVEKFGCSHVTDEDTDIEAVANYILLATSSNSAAEILEKSVSDGWLSSDEDSVKIVTSALLHISYQLSRQAWMRLPRILSTLLTAVQSNITYKTSSSTPVSLLRLSECIVDLALLQILYVTSELHMLCPSAENTAKLCLETAHAVLVDSARRSSNAPKTSNVSFYCSEALEWTKSMIKICPETWTQAEGLQLVVREFQSIITSP